VGSDRRLTGFSGETGGDKLEKKRRLLEGEGVKFDADGRVSAESFLSSLEPAIGDELAKRRKPDDDKTG